MASFDRNKLFAKAIEGPGGWNQCGVQTCVGRAWAGSVRRAEYRYLLDNVRIEAGQALGLAGRRNRARARVRAGARVVRIGCDVEGLGVKGGCCRSRR
jgi:hypothetical protein